MTTNTGPTQVRPQVRPEGVGPGHVGQVRPGAPPLRGADQSDPVRGEVHKSDPNPGSDHNHDHQTRHLLQAADVAHITGDAPGAQALLLACPRCSR